MRTQRRRFLRRTSFTSLCSEPKKACAWTKEDGSSSPSTDLLFIWLSEQVSKYCLSDGDCHHDGKLPISRKARKRACDDDDDDGGGGGLQLDLSPTHTNAQTPAKTGAQTGFLTNAFNSGARTCALLYRMFSRLCPPPQTRRHDREELEGNTFMKDASPFLFRILSHFDKELRLRSGILSRLHIKSVAQRRRCAVCRCAPPKV